MTEHLPQNETSLPKQSVLPDGWISKIFAHMEALYGSLFADRWRGTDLAAVKTLWAKKLGVFADNPKAIGLALEALDDVKFPPTLPEFLEMCRMAAKRIASVGVMAIGYQPTAEELEKGRAITEKAAKIIRKESGYDHKAWAKNLRTAYLNGLVVNQVQIYAGSSALDEVWVNGTCYPAKVAV